jgi:hypothetical protein
LNSALGKCGRSENEIASSCSRPGDGAAGRVIPRIARLMAFAIRFEGLVRDERVRDYAELARLGCVTRARMTQIVANRIDWNEQRRLFQKLCKF